MGISGDEARSIGKEAADKVIKSAQACRCGIAMWDASATSQFFAGIIDAKQPALLQPLPRLMEDVLSIVEQECGVDISKSKELSKHLEADIEKRDWGEARVNFALLRGSILGPLQQCATEGSNPGSQYVTVDDPGKTTFKPGEIISKDTFDKENERVRKLGEKPATEGGESRVVHHSDTLHCHLTPFITGEWKLEKSRWNGKEWKAEPDRYFRSAEEAFKVFDKEC